MTVVTDVNAELAATVLSPKRTRWRVAGAVAVAAGVGIVSFVFRFNTLGGALGYVAVPKLGKKVSTASAAT